MPQPWPPSVLTSAAFFGTGADGGCFHKHVSQIAQYSSISILKYQSQSVKQHLQSHQSNLIRQLSQQRARNECLLLGRLQLWGQNPPGGGRNTHGVNFLLWQCCFKGQSSSVNLLSHNVFKMLQWWVRLQTRKLVGKKSPLKRDPVCLSKYSYTCTYILRSMFEELFTQNLNPMLLIEMKLCVYLSHWDVISV